MARHTKMSASAGPHAGPAKAKVKVWDPLVRLFHWTVAFGCLYNAFELADDRTLHEVIGYTVLAALGIRVVWGFLGTKHAKFASFVRGPREVATYAWAFVRGREPRHLGHNPLAALMILTLMALIAGLGVTGWMMGLNAYWGEAWLQELHEFMSNALLALVTVHVLAAVYESVKHRENLIWAMVTGRKRP
jgi:cytochrome b